MFIIRDTMATKKRRVVLSEDAKRSKKARLLRKLRDGVGQYLEPQDEGYRELVSSAYNKFRLIPSHQTPLSLHSRVQLSLSCLLSSGYFMHNLVTKETKILLTPVTRFITGIRGLTYPYLGLRLFAFPWEFEGDPKSDVEKSLCVLRVLNDYMELKGNELCGERGANEFNMTLVNYMDPDHVTIPLVTEPYYAMGTSAVHWHSDQSVRDDCSIGVYSSTVGESNESEPWSIGLKIAWDVTTSAVKVPLLNGSCYFLLNDMNTTHQHTVIVGDNARFSSTHRVVVLDGNTLEYISGRCRQAEMIAKRLNGEGSVCCQDKLEECLDVQREVEFEWIRQFWSLGRLNAERHAGFWLREIERIEQTWERVESADILNLYGL
ncbi:alpha-ketoglutarate-dependent dioxygenase FTO-like isoform X2 [Corticium candelabrum]|uniref:alpha-ketoglutarate-dependent dioxygenase FTO-like isoform X2 n=1 Tax=Corticium candelabrum TaxID=121492 RepID=UPI002E265713|nr:alpha-ketoglutarate-dependent dioxygenase FTO-like isoform X2 [Corticium candelabrum]